MIHDSWNSHQIRAIKEFSERNPDFVNQCGGLSEYERIANLVLGSIKSGNSLLINNEWSETIRLKIMELHEKLRQRWMNDFDI